MSNGDDDDARANDGADDAKATGDATGDANAGDGDNRRTARDGARATREGDDGEDARPRGKRPDISNLVSVKIDNVSYELREEDLREAFEKFGDVGDVYIPKERGSYRARGFAFVRYHSREHAEAAVSAMHETELGGRHIRAAIAERGRPEGGYQANNNRGRYEARRPYDDDRRRDDYRDRRRDGDGYRRDDYRRDDYRRDDYRRDDYRRDDYRRDDYRDRRDDYRDRRDDYRDRRDDYRDRRDDYRDRRRDDYRDRRDDSRRSGYSGHDDRRGYDDHRGRDDRYDGRRDSRSAPPPPSRE